MLLIIGKVSRSVFTVLPSLGILDSSRDVNVFITAGTDTVVLLVTDTDNRTLSLFGADACKIYFFLELKRRGRSVKLSLIVKKFYYWSILV